MNCHGLPLRARDLLTHFTTLASIRSHIDTGKLNMSTTLQRIGRKSTTILRRLSVAKREYPDFIIIGAMKAGTTSLFSYLNQHYQLKSSVVKEVHYFDSPNYKETNHHWYRARFPIVSNGIKTFEASPRYLLNPDVPERIHKTIPGVKLIAILRNPVERAISHYYHMKTGGREKLNLMEALEAEEERLEYAHKNRDYLDERYVSFSYKLRGHYAEQLEAYYQYFSKDQLLILNTKQLREDVHGTLKKIYDFVGVDPDVVIDDVKPRHVSKAKKHVDDEVSDYLNNYYTAHNQKLYALLDKDFGW